MAWLEYLSLNHEGKVWKKPAGIAAAADPARPFIAYANFHDLEKLAYAHESDEADACMYR